AQFAGVKTKGAFYQQLNKARKAAGNGEGVTTPEKPTTPTVPKPTPTPGTSKPGKPSTPNTGKPGTVNKGKQAKVTAAYLNVRAGASSKAKVVAAVPKGTLLEVISTDKYGWVKVKLDGRVAFVYGKYVSILK
ncbi:SH3 domain-containing protein, partial [Paenibacillus sp.]